MHAFLIETADLKDEDIASIQFETKIYFEIKKIADARNFISFLKFPPNRKTLIVITGLDDSSIESQNAILKTLEDEKENALFLIVVNNIGNILQTILSRVQIISKKNIDNKGAIDTFSNLKKDEQLDLLSKLKERGTAISFLTEIAKDMNEKTLIKESAIEAISKLNRNTNVNLTLLSFITSI